MSYLGTAYDRYNQKIVIIQDTLASNEGIPQFCFDKMIYHNKSNVIVACLGDLATSATLNIELRKKNLLTYKDFINEVKILLPKVRTEITSLINEPLARTQIFVIGFNQNVPSITSFRIANSAKKLKIEDYSSSTYSKQNYLTVPEARLEKSFPEILEHTHSKSKIIIKDGYDREDKKLLTVKEQLILIGLNAHVKECMSLIDNKTTIGGELICYELSRNSFSMREKVKTFPENGLHNINSSLISLEAALEKALLNEPLT